MSGASLLIGEGSSKSLLVAGVCLGSNRSEISEFSITEIDDEGNKFTEKIKRIHEFGVACALSSLNNWRPNFLREEEIDQLW